MLKLIQELDLLTEEQAANQKITIMESADRMLGQFYMKLNNRHRSLKQQDLDITELSEILAGFRVIGKSEFRSGFADISSPRAFLRLLNDLGEPGQEPAFGESDKAEHKLIADERIREIGKSSPSFVERYAEQLKQIDEDPDDTETREALLREINKMRHFFEQARYKLKTHVASSAKTAVPGPNGKFSMT